MEWPNPHHPTKRAPRSAITYLEKSEMDALLNAPDQSTDQGRRDHALLLFLYNTGARADGAPQVKILDLAIGHSSRDHSLVQICGKGKKIRRCPLWPQTVGELSPLIARRAARRTRFPEQVWRTHHAFRDPHDGRGYVRKQCPPCLPSLASG